MHLCFAISFDEHVSKPSMSPSYWFLFSLTISGMLSPKHIEVLIRGYIQKQYMPILCQVRTKMVLKVKLYCEQPRFALIKQSYSVRLNLSKQFYHQAFHSSLILLRPLSEHTSPHTSEHNLAIYVNIDSMSYRVTL